ncbi:MAG: hypothetical protein AAFN74_23365, partial [Myxococcota bacterium]
MNGVWRAAAVVVACSVWAAPAAFAQDKLTKSKAKRVAGASKSTRRTKRTKAEVRKALDRATNLLKTGRFEEAAIELYAYMRKHRAGRSRARYHLAKALYRMEAYRSALYHFTRLLARGPKNRYYRSSLEWCLFIGRKLGDDDAVDEVVARFGGRSFPPAYEDEFFFRLARFHFERALAIERGELEGRKVQTRVEERPTGGKSIKGDPFGDDLFADEPPPAKPKGPQGPDAPKSNKSNKKGAISLDADLFSDPSEVEQKAPPPPPPPPKKKRRRRRLSDPWVLTSAEHLRAASELVVQVAPSSRYGLRAKFLEGVLLYNEGRPNEALGAFKNIIKATRTATRADDERLRQMAFFQLARTHFGAEQPSFSIFYYDKIDRDGQAWLDALYERSWAEFRLGNYEKALGNLLTLHAPFFDDTSYPESLILKAVVFYENCRYPEAKAILADFLKRYEPVHDELKRLTEQKKDPEAYYESIEMLRKTAQRDGDAKARTLAQVLDIALSDAELGRLDGAYRSVGAEMARLDRTNAAFKSSRLHAVLT